MLIMHIVVLNWRPEVAASQVAEVDEALSQLPIQIPELVSYSFGANLHLRDPGGDYAICAVVESGDMDRYLDHPAHCEVRDRLISPLVSDRSAAQLSVEAALAQLLMEARSDPTP